MQIGTTGINDLMQIAVIGHCLLPTRGCVKRISWSNLTSDTQSAEIKLLGSNISHGCNVRSFGLILCPLDSFLPWTMAVLARTRVEFGGEITISLAFSTVEGLLESSKLTLDSAFNHSPTHVYRWTRSVQTEVNTSLVLG